MAIGDKYYRQYLTLARCGVNQQDAAVVSPSTIESDDGCVASSSSKSSFETWKSLLQERYVFQIYISAATKQTFLLCMLLLILQHIAITIS